MISSSEEETKKIGKQIGKKLKKGDIVALYGEFGAGKTVLVKGIAKGMECKEQVKSPSFVFMHEYKGKFPIYHIDLYRVNNLNDITALGIQEFFGSFGESCGQGVCVIEWAEKAKGLLPENSICIELKILNENTREIFVNRDCGSWS
ncbi:tRNA (adenosine(37)-N6)-threonylcarbamoyltransferase complex ATPase subunit type 1 TsaE [candidate division WOR-3 bacterium]|nr:tRNA (adenosine(37)-N6)-threonylcarbamoyltransferase complex ATPase subunit type 1 TsaE [candidate division WOR-3 bacterium]